MEKNIIKFGPLGRIFVFHHVEATFTTPPETTHEATIKLELSPEMLDIMEEIDELYSKEYSDKITN